jgi:hypothetical protein
MNQLFSAAQISHLRAEFSRSKRLILRADLHEVMRDVGLDGFPQLRQYAMPISSSEQLGRTASSEGNPMIKMTKPCVATQARQGRARCDLWATDL